MIGFAPDPPLSLRLDLAIIAVVGVLAICAPRSPAWTRILWQSTALLALTALTLPQLGSPFAPEFDKRADFARLAQQVVMTAWWILVAWISVGLIQVVVVFENKSREARIVSDIMAGAIYIATALAVVSFVLSVPVRGLLATSGIIVIVLGLALQSTLSDLFSGIAVGAERPYRLGDTLWVEGGISGRVTQINWRSTHMQTGQDVAIVPNSVIAKSKLINRSAPTTLSVDSLEVRVHPDVKPETAKTVIRAALLACDEIAPDYKTTVQCTALSGDGTTFTIHFGAPTSDAIGSARSEILMKVHRYLSHATIPLVISGTSPAAPLPAPQGIETLLARSELWSGMANENRVLLARRFEFTSLDEGQLLYREGDKADALYVVASGTMQIVVGDSAAPQLRHSMGPGETIGAVALITGQSIHATARALTDAGLYRLQEDSLASAMGEAPDLAVDLERTVARAQQLIARFAAMEGQASMAHPAALLDRLRGFIRRLGAPAFH